jgi:hypothetical protein
MPLTSFQTGIVRAIVSQEGASTKSNGRMIALERVDSVHAFQKGRPVDPLRPVRRRVLVLLLGPAVRDQ